MLQFAIKQLRMKYFNSYSDWNMSNVVLFIAESSNGIFS